MTRLEIKSTNRALARQLEIFFKKENVVRYRDYLIQHGRPLLFDFKTESRLTIMQSAILAAFGALGYKVIDSINDETTVSLTVTRKTVKELEEE